MSLLYRSERQDGAITQPPDPLPSRLKPSESKPLVSFSSLGRMAHKANLATQH